MKDLDSRPMSIEGPYSNERARLDGTFTDADRQWRKRFLKDQELTHHEPRKVPDVNRYNPIRRAYRFPLDFIFSKLEPTLVCICLDYQSFFQVPRVVCTPQLVSFRKPCPYDIILDNHSFMDPLS